jgi:hypothetical protein
LRTRINFFAAGLFALAGLGAVAGDALARERRQSTREEYQQSRPAGQPVMAIVSLRHQRVTIYDSDGWIMRAPVSSGQTGYETPAGVYSILQRKAEHYSNLYDDASMPFMQRLTWSGIALHAGALPGYPASHGCVRMPHGFAERLFDLTRLGMRVIVMRDDIEPAEISHPLLFKPAPDEGGTSTAAGPSLVLSDAAPPATTPRSLRKIAGVKAAEAERASGAADEARRTAAAKYKEAARANKTLRVAQVAKAKADAYVHEMERRLEKITDPSETLQDARNKAMEQAAAAQARLDAVQAEVQPVLDATAQLREAAAAAEKAKLAAQEEARDAKRKLAPVSVFISRATQRLYVRQALQPLFESPVAIAAPEEQLGTYVFTALAFADGERDLRWNAVSMYDGMHTPEPQQKGRHKHAPPPVSGADKTDIRQAASALDRISIPKDAADRIAEVISPGSALVISDEPLSKETGQATEFIVIMSGEPQGGIKMRKRETPEARNRYDRFYRRSPYGWGPSFW